MKKEKPINDIQQDIIEQLEQINERTRQLGTDLTDEAFNRQPEPGKWSIGECIEHLNITGIGYLNKMQDVNKKAEDAGPDADSKPITVYKPRFSMRKFIELLEPPAKRVFKTPKAFNPAMEQANVPDKEKTLETFLTLNENLKETLAESFRLNTLKHKFTSPASALVKPQMLEGFMIVAAHARRHLEQAEKIKK